ncbi:MAG: helix-turn-helix transcriptional regulator [Mesorhizobium sp.]
MVTIVDTLTASLASGVNPVTALREATGYSLDQIAIASGLTVSDLSDIEAKGLMDPETLTRITSALGIPAKMAS